MFGVEPIVLRESPRPQARGRFHGRFHGRRQEVREENLAFQSLPALLSKSNDLYEHVWLYLVNPMICMDMYGFA